MKRYLIANCALFLMFSMLCGLSDSLTMMVICRVGQGFTGGVFIPLAMTIVLRCLPPSKQPIGLTLFGVTATFAPAIGPTIGGWLTDTLSWHWIFYINLFPGMVMMWTIWYGLRKEPMHLERLRRGDWPGIVSMAIGLGSLITVLEEGQRKDWFGNPTIVGRSSNSAGRSWCGQSGRRSWWCRCRRSPPVRSPSAIRRTPQRSSTSCAIWAARSGSQCSRPM